MKHRLAPSLLRLVRKNLDMVAEPPDWKTVMVATNDLVRRLPRSPSPMKSSASGMAAKHWLRGRVPTECGPEDETDAKSDASDGSCGEGPWNNALYSGVFNRKKWRCPWPALTGGDSDEHFLQDPPRGIYRDNAVPEEVVHRTKASRARSRRKRLRKKKRVNALIILRKV